MQRNLVLLVTTSFFIAIGCLVKFRESTELPLIAIANYGPHHSLEDSITGAKAELARQGFIEHRNIRYSIADVGFDTALIPQMISTLKNQSPAVMVVIATPIAQYAKGAVSDIPLIYCDITDPIGAGLKNLSGSSDRQDLSLMLNFAKKILPSAKRVGLLYSTAETNDLILLKMMQKAAAQLNMTVVAIPIDQARDVPLRMALFKDKVDFIYVGGSGPIQPTLPAIAAAADKMKIPVVNVEEEAVRKGLVLASFGVSYQQVGANAGKLIAKILKNSDQDYPNPLYPSTNDHHGFINKNKARSLDLQIPNLENVEIVS